MNDELEMTNENDCANEKNILGTMENQVYAWRLFFDHFLSQILKVPWIVPFFF